MLNDIYRLTLRLLPPQLRRKHGAAMQTLFARELEHARARGLTHAAIAGVAGIADVLGRSIYELVRMSNIQIEGANMSLPTTWQLLRRHAFSFTLALVGLTAVMLYQFASRQISTLSARGDSPGMIVSALVLCMPFIMAMTIPMSVLVSVLYEFTRLGADGTLAAARLVRDGVRRIVAPVLLAAAGMTLVAFAVTAEVVPRANARLANVMAGRVQAPGERTMTVSALRAAVKKAEAAGSADAASYQVEIQKKFALPGACLVLAFAGMVLAFRIPRGGVALVFIGSVLCFSAYYGLLMTGETLADRHAVSPFVGMWGANAFFLACAWLAWRWRRADVRAASSALS